MKPFSRLIASSLLALGLRAVGRADIVDDLVRSRGRLAPFHAVYLEEVRVAREAKPSEGIPAWGSVNSRQEVRSAVDRTSSLLVLPSLMPNHPGTFTGESYFTGPKVTYSAVEGGRRGHFGTHRSGLYNPAAAAYELAGCPVEDYLERFNHRVIAPNTVRVTDGDYEEDLTLERRGDQTVIAADTDVKAHGITSRSRVEAWVDHKGFSYPKRCVIETLQDGRVEKSRTYTLLRIEKDETPLAFAFREGANMEDLDRHIRYDVVKGRLVEDPDGVVARRLTSRRRLMFIGSGLVIGAWLVVVARRRRGRSASPTAA